MDQQSHSSLSFGIAHTILLRSRAAQGNGIHKLQMAGIETERKLDAVFGGFHAPLEPAANIQLVDVHVLHTNRAAICIAQPLKESAEGQWTIILKSLAVNRQI